MFSIFINDLHDVTCQTTLSNYADDTHAHVSFAGNHREELERVLNACLARIDKLDLDHESNEKKSPKVYQAMVIARKNKR